MSAAQDQQRRDALDAANERRLERARVKRQIASGEIDWRMVILDPPDCIAGLLLTEVLLLLPWMGRRRVERLGMLAHEFGLSLTVRAGKASRSTRQWVVTYALPNAPGRRALPGHGDLRVGRAR
jgi:hypothetical protein